MNEYWLGVITPFALIAGLALVAAVVYALFRLGDWLNSKTHGHMVEKITISPNLADPFGTKPARPRYYDKATKFRDALLKSPQMWLLRGFGLVILIVRDFEEKSSTPAQGATKARRGQARKEQV